MEKVTTKTFLEMKRKGEKIAVLTSYDFPTAKIIESAGIEAIIVGDSAGNVFYGYETTLPVTMAQMLSHVQAVSRAVERPLVIADMPFLSYQVSLPQAIENAGRFLKEAGAQAVKLEGGLEMIETVSKLVSVGIPVMGHIGLLPQSIHRFGGYKAQGREETARKYLVDSAVALEGAGCFSIVLEAMLSRVAREITERLKIPTIGIGAGPHCDGQVLVIYDMLGITSEFNPKYLRLYAHLGGEIQRAVEDYIRDVKSGEYPSEKESYH